MGKDFWANFIFCLVLAVLLVFAVTRIGSALTSKGLLVSEPKASTEAASLLKDVVITRYSMIQGRNHEVSADFYIRNNSARDVKNVHVLCDFVDDKGVYLDREKWILSQAFPRGEEHKAASVLNRFVNMKGTSNCRVTDLQIVRDSVSMRHSSAAGPGGPVPGESGHAAPQAGGH